MEFWRRRTKNLFRKSSSVFVLFIFISCAIFNIYLVSFTINLNDSNQTDRNSPEAIEKKIAETNKKATNRESPSILKRHLLDAVANSLTISSYFPNKLKSENHKREKLLNELFNSTFKLPTAEHRFREIGNQNKFIGCNEIANLQRRTLIGSGYTKIVESAWRGDTRVALKHPFREGPDVKACVTRGASEDECLQVASYKIMKEMTLLQQLRHPNIIRLLGYCLNTPELPKRDVQRSVLTVVVEYGEPLSFLKLVQQPWEERLRMAYGVTDLLVYLATSSLGSLVIHDFKSTQFVTVDGEIKLSDLDDIDSNIPPCSSDNTCTLQMGNNSKTLPCNSNKQCLSYAETHNLHYAYVRFYSLLGHGGPAELQPSIDTFMKNAESLSLTPEQALSSLMKIVQSFREGMYIQPHATSNYTVLKNMDIPNRHDYWCEQSRNLAFNSCVLSAHDVNEAKLMCDMDKNCEAFVFTKQKTWTGRYIVYFKDGVDSIVSSAGNTLYLLNR